MKASASSSTVSPSPAAPKSALLLLPFVAAVVCYLLPWVVNPAAALTLGAWDLAEWLTLARDVDMLPTSLLLRLIPALLVWIVALWYGAPRFTPAWWGALALVLVMSVALLPPPEILQERDNANYRQLLLVAGLACAGGGVGLTGLLPRLRPALVAVLALAAIACAAAAFTQAMTFIHTLLPHAGTGVGALGTATAFAVIALTALVALRGAK